jgi:hypothetical protein
MSASGGTTLSVLGHEAVIGTCELCIQPEVQLTDTVSVQRRGRALAVLAACDRCGRAMRRLAALIGPSSTVVAADVASTSATSPQPDDLEPRRASEPHLVHTFGEPLLASDGQHYTVRVYGAARTDGTWVAWLSFIDPLTAETRQTGPESTQSNLAGVSYWATGLAPTYLEGAFARARSVTTIAPPSAAVVGR